jgi:hypothetical protein
MSVLRLGQRLNTLITCSPDFIYYQVRYWQHHGRFCDFQKPRFFSEKIFHRMRYPHPVFSRLADKVEVRRYLAATVGEQYLVPAYFSCEEVTPEIFDRLPTTFVMKANHSAGQVKIILCKEKENLEALAQLAKSWLESDFSVRYREKHYKFIKPKILFEKTLLTDGRPPDDYKVNVFNAGDNNEPYVFIQHMHGRLVNPTQEIYLEDWSLAPFQRRGKNSSAVAAHKPSLLGEMLRIAKQLAVPFGYLRVDFYLHQGQLYIGELTLTPAAGSYTFDPAEWDELLGSKFGWPEPIALSNSLVAECSGKISNNGLPCERSL